MTVYDISELINDDYNKFLEFDEKTGKELSEEIIYHALKDDINEYREEMYEIVDDYKKEDNVDIYYEDLLKPSHDLREFYNVYIVNDSSNKAIVDYVESDDFIEISKYSGISYGERLESIVSSWRDTHDFIDADYILGLIDDELYNLREEPVGYDPEAKSAFSVAFDASDSIFNTITENVEESFQGHLYGIKSWVSQFRNSPDLQLLSKTAKDLGLEYDDEKNKMIFNKGGN